MHFQQISIQQCERMHAAMHASRLYLAEAWKGPERHSTQITCRFKLLLLSLSEWQQPDW